MQSNLSKVPTYPSLPWLPQRTILYVVHGSRAYGTFTPTSDYDYKGVCVPSREFRDGFLKKFEQAEFKTPVDATIYEVRKFFSLAAECNPNIIEVLWVDDEAVVHSTVVGEELRAARSKFLSKKAFYTFRGYAMAQLKRIASHRKWLLDPPTHLPTRVEFGLSDSSSGVPKEQLEVAMTVIRKKLDSWEIDFGDLSEPVVLYIQEQITKTLGELHIGVEQKFWAAGRWLGFGDNLIEFLVQEQKYRLAKKNWDQYITWQSERNPDRAALEAKFGFDCKHGSHLVRLLRMCEEILGEGVVRVRRPDAEELLAIRQGAWTYDCLMEWAERQEMKLQELVKTSVLPWGPDRNHLHNFCIQICNEMG